MNLNDRWLDVVFGHRYARRLAIAVACSIALHEIFAALLPPSIARPAETPEVVTRVSLARIVHRATPTPRPTPTPSPPPPRSAVIAQALAEGQSARAERIRHMGAMRPKPPHIVDASPVPAAVSSGQGAGEGNAEGAGSLGNGGNGTGAGTQGTGAGAGPCGAVDFAPIGGPVQNPDTGEIEYHNVNATVYYPGGKWEIVHLDWTWRYKSEDDDPFTHPALPIYFQPPPPGQVANEPPAVQYIIKHSTSYGGTTLNDRCPDVPQPSAPPQL